MAVNKKAENVRSLYESARSGDREAWEERSQQAYDFYLNEQLTDAEITSLEEQGMPTFVINRISPVIEVMLFFVTDGNPRWQVVGVDGSDADIAHIHSVIADYCWAKSQGQTVYSQAIRDSLVKGVGYIQVDVDSNSDRGMGDVVFKRLEPYDVYVDPMSRDFLFRDASFICIKKNIMREQLMQDLPEFKRKIKSANSNEPTGSTSLTRRDMDTTQVIQGNDIMGSFKKTGEEDDILDYYECYTKKNIPYMNVTMVQTLPPDIKKKIQKKIAIQIGIMEEEAKVALLELEKQLQMQVQEQQILPERAQLEMDKARIESQEQLKMQKEEMIASEEKMAQTTIQKVIPQEDYDRLIEEPIFKQSVVDAIPYFEVRVVQMAVVGDKFLYEIALPVSEYPIIPICYNHTGTPFPVSAVVPLVGKQQEINKAHQLMIHNANLASNLRWMYEEGSIPEDEWEMYSASPGALLKIRQGFNAPTPVQPLPLNAAFAGIVGEGKQDMEYLSGVYSQMQGDTQNQPETYRGLLATDEHGTRRVRQLLKNGIEPALEHLGKVFMDFAQDIYTVNRVFRISQPNKAGDMVDDTAEINIPIYNDLGESIGLHNDYASVTFDVRVIGGSTLPLNRWALIDEYFRWFQAGLIDDIAMLAETDIRGKENIVKRKSVYAQMKSQIEGLEQQLKQVRGDNETLQRQVIQSGMRDKVRDFEMVTKEQAMQTKAQQQVLRGETKYRAKEDLKKLGGDLSTALNTKQNEA